MDTKETWVKLDEFAATAHLEKSEILQMVADGKLKSKNENNTIFIDASSAPELIAKSSSAVVLSSPNGVVSVDSDFVEKTIGTILSLHEKVIKSKEETLASMRNENTFLKDALFNTQEVYDDDKKTIATLREQVKFLQEENEFLKRKYRLMWGKVIDREAERK